jgi:hypothetical protein
MAKTFSLARFGTDAKGIIAAAQKRADEMRHAHVTPAHLLVELLERKPRARDAVASLSVDPAQVLERASAAIGGLAADGDGKSFLSAELIELLRRAEMEAGSEEVDIGDLLNALAQSADASTREVLQAHGIRPGAFRSFFVEPADAPADEDEGEALLRDFASEVRGELRDADERQLRERGRTLIQRLAEQLSGRDGIPGLRVHREDERRIRLERLPRDAEIIVEWEADSGAVALHRRKKEERSVTRYLWHRTDERWASVEGQGFYRDLKAALSYCFFPEIG